MFLLLYLGTSAVPLQAADIPGRRVERSFIGSPSSPAFGRPTLPDFEQDQPAEQVLPPLDTAPPPSPTPGSAEPAQRRLPGMFIKTIRLTGNHAIATEQLQQISDDYQGRWVSVLELHELRQRLSQLYLQQGYINSGAIIPDQEVIDGVVEIQLIEGRLDNIKISGNQSLSTEYIRQRVLLGAGPPLNIYQLGEQLQLMETNPLLQTLKSKLAPGTQKGKAELHLRIREAPRHRLTFDLNNARSPSIGEVAAGIEYTNLSLTGNGDRLGLRGEFAEGLKSLSVSYALPLNPRETTLAFYLQREAATVVTSPFEDLNIEGDRWISSISISHPLVRDLKQQFLLSGGLEYERDESTLDGAPYSFVPWADAGVTSVTVAYFGQDWLLRDSREVLSARSTFKFGLDAFGSTRQPSGPDGQFFSWLGQFQWARRLSRPGHQMVFRSDLQLANDPLMTMEQYALGGINSVRGYRTNQLVTDSAFFASLEYRIALQLPQPRFSQNNHLQLALFADYGDGWNRERELLQPTPIYSIGAGLIWDPDPTFHAELYWGIPLQDVHNLNQSIQDNGIYFRLVYWPVVTTGGS